MSNHPSSPKLLTLLEIVALFNELPDEMPVLLNQSSYKEYLSCKRKFAWRRLQNLEPVGRRSALEIGTATHLALAKVHSGSTIEEGLDAAKEKLRERAGPTTAFQDKELWEAEEIVERLLPAYYEHWKEAGELWVPLNQEIEFTVEVGENSNVFLKGRADNLSTAKGGLYLVDYKTAGRMDPRDLLKYEMDIQLSAYIYGLTKWLTEESIRKGGEPVFIRGGIIDLLVKTKVPQFAREMFTRSLDELAEFELEWIEVGRDLRHRLQRVAAGEDWKIVFHKNTNECFSYGTCPYRDVCLKDTPTRRALYNKRETDYVDEGLNALIAPFLAGRTEPASVSPTPSEGAKHES
jgi:hypothetical protein